MTRLASQAYVDLSVFNAGCSMAYLLSSRWENTMALTASTMMALGTKAPDFKLWEPSQQKMMSLDECLQDKLFVTIWFICNHCPYVKHVRHELARLGKDYLAKGVAIVAINSNDADSYPDDRPELMVKEKVDFGYNFPYLYDEDQSVAKAYQAACTPDFFVFDATRLLVYRGQLDGSRPGNHMPVDGKDLRKALDLVLADQHVPVDQRPSLGCNIKWRKGNQPDYFD
jgi:thiol-disulfide isomerase/thioredoxin